MVRISLDPGRVVYGVYSFWYCHGIVRLASYPGLPGDENYVQPVLVGQFVRAYFSLSCLTVMQGFRKVKKKKKILKKKKERFRDDLSYSTSQIAKKQRKFPSFSLSPIKVLKLGDGSWILGYSDKEMAWHV